MRAKRATIVSPMNEADLPADQIHLPVDKLKALESSIPFHHSPAEQEPIEAVVKDAPPLHPAKRKWHEDHDAMVEDYDTDVVLNERRDKGHGIDTPL